MTIHVLGLGETLEDFEHDGNITIGVNDIHSYFCSDYVVCIDEPRAFPDKKRLNTIQQTKCKGFYSHLDCWKHLENFNKIELISPRGSVENLDSEGFCYSISSPFVACVLAYKMGAKKIVLWGVDFMSHPEINSHRRDKAIADFKRLNEAFIQRGVQMFVGDSFSYLSTFLPVWNP